MLGHAIDLTGKPWELDQPPRQMYLITDNAHFGGPPVRKWRALKPQDPTLDAINERPSARARR